MGYDRAYAAMLEFRGKPVIIGGYGDDGSGRSAEIYKNGGWEEMKAIPREEKTFKGHTALVVADRIYTFGGYKGDGRLVQYSCVFDPTQWKRIGELKILE